MTAIFKRTRVLRVKYDGAVSTQQCDMRDRGATLRLGGHISDSILGVIISKMFRGHVLPPRSLANLNYKYVRWEATDAHWPYLGISKVVIFKHSFRGNPINISHSSFQ